jgi:hypothetical protein
MTTAADAQRCWEAFAAMAEATRSDWLRRAEDPERNQAFRLTELLRKNAATDFGRMHGFDGIKSLTEYQARVPVQTWSDVAPWIERSKRESLAPLSCETPDFFERTSGSSSARKHIPYTPGLLAEFQRALVVWLSELHRSCPGVARGRGYWALSPAGHPPEIAPNGKRIGSISDADYVRGSVAERLLGSALIPAGVLDASPATSWRRATLVALLGAEDLAFLSLWSPTFLTALLQPLLDPASPDHHSMLDALNSNLPAHRMSSLERSLGDGHFGTLWPALAAISVWMDGPSAGSAARLRPWFPQSAWCPKGLLATEGVVTFSWGNSGLNPLAIDSHVLEFLDDKGAPCPISALEEGHRYSPLISTSGGLYRYRLGDIVEVTGRLGAIPCVRFAGREDARCDLVGEKLDETLVDAVFDRAFGKASGACLVPVPDSIPQYYLLLVPAQHGPRLDRIRVEVEAELQRVFHYAHARRLGQLASLEACAVHDPATLLQLSWEATGARAGDSKPRALVTSLPHARELARALREQSGPRA